MPHGGLADARVLAERVRDALAAQGRIEPHTAITVSAGCELLARRSDG
jgi:hypothetical protein